jgi:hypothetical protein
MSALMIGFTVLCVLVAAGIGLFVCFLFVILARVCWYAHIAALSGVKIETGSAIPKVLKASKRKWLKLSMPKLLARKTEKVAA